MPQPEEPLLKEPDAAERLRRRKLFLDAMAESTGLKQEMEHLGQKKTLAHIFEKRLSLSQKKGGGVPSVVKMCQTDQHQKREAR